jgi:hypothetical protein
VTSRASKGIVKPVISDLREYRTHTMLSQGNFYGNFYFTHSTMAASPGALGFSSGNNPHLNVSLLRYAGPGASQISSAAAYVSLYGYDNGGVEYISKHHGGCETPYDPNLNPDSACTGTGGQKIADYFMSAPNPIAKRWIPWTCQTVRVLPGTHYYDCNGEPQTAATCPPSTDRRACPRDYYVNARVGGNYWRYQRRDGEARYDIPYSLHQYADIEGMNEWYGLVSWGGPPAADGVVCSTLMAHGTVAALGRNVQPKRYDHGTTANALWDLWSGAYSACMDGAGTLESIFADGICAETASQVTNCFVDSEHCNDSSYYWADVGNNPALQAYSISPDLISGWAPDQDWSNTSINSPWTISYEYPVSFSGGGATYSCWFN